MNPRRPPQARRKMKQSTIQGIHCHRISFEIRFATFMNNEEAVKQVLSDYYNAFSTLDVQSILPYPTFTSQRCSLDR